MEETVKQIRGRGRADLLKKHMGDQVPVGMMLGSQVEVNNVPHFLMSAWDCDV